MGAPQTGVTEKRGRVDTETWYGSPHENVVQTRTRLSYVLFGRSFHTLRQSRFASDPETGQQGRNTDDFAALRRDQPDQDSQLITGVSNGMRREWNPRGSSDVDVPVLCEEDDKGGAIG